MTERTARPADSAARQGRPGGASSLGADASVSVHDYQRKIVALARLLGPKQAVGFQKIRIGRSFDGGYILVDDFSGVDAAFSFGVSDDASWDLDIAERRIPVHQFDHTIDKGPVAHPLITFHKVRIAAADAPGSARLDTLAGRLLANSRKAILKIDIEGDEWPVFAAASPATLDKFSQIVCELHGFNLLGDPAKYDYPMAVLTKLKTLFEVVHVHGNNAQPATNVFNVILPVFLEVTLANRRHYQFAETNEIFPTPLDQPNLPHLPDLHLGSFKF